MVLFVELLALRLVLELPRTADVPVPRFAPEVLRTADELLLRFVPEVLRTAEELEPRATLLVEPTMRPREADAVAAEVLAAELVAVVRRPSMRACEEVRVGVAAARVLPERRSDDDETMLLSLFLRPALREIAVA